MLTENIEIANLSENPLEAFVEFDARLRDQLHATIQQFNRNDSTIKYLYKDVADIRRDYVDAIVAYVEELNLPIDIKDISDLKNNEFTEQYRFFTKTVSQTILRFKMRIAKSGIDSINLPIIIDQDYKIEISELLQKIRKIVNTEVAESSKKDKIYKRISNLQYEIDASKTDIQAFFGNTLQLTKILGESAKNLEPLIDLTAKLKKSIMGGVSVDKFLPKKEEQKLIEMDDEDQED
ncbi:MAG: hypothetical protein COC24_009560 [Alphaproteobacteria bacterium]|nr:hypothetical protein [Alphaproteobacteria bacterium]